MAIAPASPYVARQPHAVATHGHNVAARTPPTGTPVWRMPMAKPRRRGGNQRITAALPAGFCTPVPSPRMKAATRKAQNGPANAAAIAPAPVMRPETMSTLRSPTRSARRPPTSADHVALR